MHFLNCFINKYSSSKICCDFTVMDHMLGKNINNYYFIFRKYLFRVSVSQTVCSGIQWQDKRYWGQNEMQEISCKTLDLCLFNCEFNQTDILNTGYSKPTEELTTLWVEGLDKVIWRSLSNSPILWICVF